MIWIILNLGILIISIMFACYFWNRLDAAFDKKLLTISTFLGVAVTLIVAVNILIQTQAMNNSVNIQAATSHLENRPFLHAIVQRFLVPGNGGNWYGPAVLSIKNTGRTPATIIGKPEFKVGYDGKRDINLEEYFKTVHGDSPNVTVVFPGQDSFPIPLHPEIGKNPKIAYVWSKIIYTGADSSKKYWHILKYIYRINTNKLGDAIVLIRAEEDWDGNENRAVPEFKDLEWERYLKIYEEHPDY